MGKVLKKEKRAEEVISFFKENISDLNRRTLNIKNRVKVFLGGVAYRGPHGFQSTETSYPPFLLTNTKTFFKNISGLKKKISHSIINKEKIIELDPEFIFLDLSTLQFDSKGGGLFELKNDIIYKSLTAVKKGNVYGVLPYNWYSINYGSILANSYFIGKLLYPENFKNIDPIKKADEIYKFLVGKEIFNEMNSSFQNNIFRKIPIK